LEQAFATGMLEEIRVTDLEEVQLFAKLTATGLGIGECSAIAVAAHRKLVLAIDDTRAIKKLHNMSLGLTVLTTEMLVVLLIQHDILTVAEADAMKLDWEQNHRFRLTFQSFSERI
jgi:predicted nucleic acid-binding protein